MSIISANDLCLWYGNFQALKNINIEIPEHSITALIGPSGCGKSTFLKTLNRMNDLIPTVKITGEVTYNGQNHQDGSNSKGHTKLTLFFCVNIEGNGQSCTRSCKTVNDAVDCMGKSCGKQQCRRFSHDSTHRQNAAGDYALHAVG